MSSGLELFPDTSLSALGHLIETNQKQEFYIFCPETFGKGHAVDMYAGNA